MYPSPPPSPPSEWFPQGDSQSELESYKNLIISTQISPTLPTPTMEYSEEKAQIVENSEEKAQIVEYSEQRLKK